MSMTQYCIAPISRYLWAHYSFISYAVGSPIDPVSRSIRKILPTLCGQHCTCLLTYPFYMFYLTLHEGGLIRFDLPDNNSSGYR